ncbi:HMA2 domain-containing protein [Pectobacterium sp. B1J-3]|uniref:HMA2 domain-containing protein n=1 Tax=Pectobacterium sp. B1J-3 TaxID=3385371 RepID=UPI003905E53C
MTPYLHQTQNRIRVRSDFIQKNPKLVAHTVKQLEQLDGVHEVTHRLYAGSVAICFDNQKVCVDQLLERVEQLGWMRAGKDKDYIDSTIRRGAKTLLKGLAIGALKRTVGGPIITAMSVLAR